MSIENENRKDHLEYPKCVATSQWYWNSRKHCASSLTFPQIMHATTSTHTESSQSHAKPILLCQVNPVHELRRSSRARTEIDKYLPRFGDRRSSRNGILYTEIISSRDTRRRHFEEANLKELKGLIENGTFNIVLREETGERPNIIPTRLFLDIKHGDSGSEPLKAWFVLGGHSYRKKPFLFHNSTTLRHHSVRILIALAAIFGFNLWSSNVNQAYLQAAENLQRKCSISPEILYMTSNEIVQVIKPWYGLT